LLRCWQNIRTCDEKTADVNADICHSAHDKPAVKNHAILLAQTVLLRHLNTQLN